MILIKMSSKNEMKESLDFLMKNKIVIADCQQETAHLRSLGAAPITRDVFVNHVQMTAVQPSIVDWQFDKYILQAWA